MEAHALNIKNERLEVYTLGAFLVKRGEENLSYKFRFSKKPWILFKYLISNKDKIISKDAIAEVIGLENYYSDPGQLIHNLVYRLRQMLDEEPTDNNGDSAIVFVNGGYRWNGSENNWLDTDEFDLLYKKAKTQYDNNPKEAMLLYEQAISLYKNDFLCEYLYDEFANSTRFYYHNLFLSIVHKRINYLSLIRSHNEIIETCKNALCIEYFDMELHVEYLKALLEKDDIRQALNHYEEATARLYTQEGITLPSEMTAIYKSIKQGKRNIQYSLSGIQEELSDKAKDKGALFCDIETFNFIHKLEKKRVKRFNQISCIVLISIIQSDNAVRPEESLSEEMDKVIKILLDTLRSTDVVSKWSENQFLLLLIGMPLNHVEIVFKRIMDSYRNIGSSPDYKIIKSIHQI